MLATRQGIVLGRDDNVPKQTRLGIRLVQELLKKLQPFFLETRGTSKAQKEPACQSSKRDRKSLMTTWPTCDVQFLRPERNRAPRRFETARAEHSMSLS